MMCLVNGESVRRWYPMNRKVIVRDCKASEIGKLQELVEELYYTDAGPDANVPDVAFTVRSLKKKPDKGRLVVFERDGELVGYAILIFFFSNEFGGDIIDVDEIVVTEDARGEGVGRAFFKWLGKTYKKAVGWSLQVRPVNRRARRLYESVGFVTSANLHLYNIFAWNDGNMYPWESGDKPSTSRKSTAKSVSKTVGNKKRYVASSTKKSTAARSSAKKHTVRATSSRSSAKKRTATASRSSAKKRATTASRSSARTL